MIAKMSIVHIVLFKFKEGIEEDVVRDVGEPRVLSNGTPRSGIGEREGWKGEKETS